LEKTVFIIPAAGQKTKLSTYQEIGSYFAKRGITPAFIDIDWRWRKSIEDCAQEAELKIREIIEQKPCAELYFFGFSMGAILAHILSGHYDAKAQVLASMPPFFSDDIPRLTYRMRFFANFFIYPGADKPRYPDNRLYSELKTYFLIGENEGKFERGELLGFRKHNYPNHEIFIVSKAKHRLDENYLRGLKKVIGFL